MCLKQNNILKNFYINKLKPQFKQALDDMRHPGNHPRKTALSVALGIFVGIFIPMGLQVWTLTLLVLFIRFNLLTSSLVTLISNPFTILPIYYTGIMLGESITNMPFPWHYFDMFITQPSWDNLLHVGRDGALVFLTGLFVFGILAALFCYLLTFRFASLLQQRANAVLQER